MPEKALFVPKIFYMPDGYAMIKTRRREAYMKQKERKKTTARKPKYGFFSCVAYSLGVMWKSSKGTAVSAVAVIPVSLALYAIGLYMPSILLRELELGDAFFRIVWLIFALVGAQLVFSLIKQYIDIKRSDAEHVVVNEMHYDLRARRRDMDYFLDLDPENEQIITRAETAVRNNHTAGVHFIEYCSNMLLHILSFVLFGAVISTISPWILLLLIAGCLINYYMAKWQQRQNYKTRDKRNAISKKWLYLTWTVSTDLGYGKEIRLFHFVGFFDKLIAKVKGEWYSEYEKVEKRSFLVSLVSFFIVLIRDGVAYAFLIWLAVDGRIDSAQFVLYFSAISQISGFVAGILNTWSRMHEGALGVSDYREFFDIRDTLNRADGIPLPDAKAVSIEFRNVSYRYPTGDKKILDNISFHIRAGEKVALVGVNGAGKTTMTMLMCGLLVPDEGEVLIDGHSVYEYNRDELYKMFSLVPQKYSLMPVSIAENIAIVDREAGERIDTQKLERCIRMAGLEEKVSALPKSVETPLNRQINEEATDLSGGEIQKLLLARAIYRDAKILILDEPTAALDPIAEDAMYRRYDEISSSSTSIFISHRLASTRFCDRIFFLDGACIAEQGTHDSLMEMGGKYRQLFDVQAKYYKEASENETETNV